MENAFKELVWTFTQSIKNWRFYVDWDKVNQNKRNYELLLHKLNFLIWNESDFKENFFFLLKNQPEVIELFPLLLATREKDFIMLDWMEEKRFSFERRPFISDKEIWELYNFVLLTWLDGLFVSYNIKNLVDYIFWVEVWLDSNARKNRTWFLMENIVWNFIEEFCIKNSYKFNAQVTANRISDNWNIKVQSDKASRRYDYAIYNWREVFLIETNFYNWGWSKLKAVAWEFSWLYQKLKHQGVKFFWITDGSIGWKTALRPLEDSFIQMNWNIYNISMLRNWILDDIIL